MVLGNVFFPDTPQRQIADLPQEGQSVINDAVAKADEPISAEYAKNDQDLAAGSGAYDSFNLGSDAIKQKYGNILSNQLAGDSTALNLQSRQIQISNMQRAQTALLARQQVQNDIFAKNMQNQLMLETARAQALMSILGFAGSASGMYFAGMHQQPRGRTRTVEPNPFEGGASDGNYYDYTPRRGSNTELARGWVPVEPSIG